MGNYLSGESSVLCPGAVVYNLCLIYVRKNWQCNMLCKYNCPYQYTHLRPFMALIMWLRELVLLHNHLKPLSSRWRN